MFICYALNFTLGQRNLIWLKYNEPSLMAYGLGGSQGNHYPPSSASVGLFHTTSRQLSNFMTN